LAASVDVRSLPQETRKASDPHSGFPAVSTGAAATSEHEAFDVFFSVGNCKQDRLYATPPGFAEYFSAVERR